MGVGGGGASCDPQQELGRHNINMYGLSNHSGCFVFLLPLTDSLWSEHSHLQPLQ